MDKKPPHRGAGTERLAKTIARAGLASRRDAEAMILAGRVTVNGKTVEDVATNVGPKDKVALDGAPLPAREAARLWLYHKPSGLVTTEKDEQGRPTVFEALRPELGRVLSVGRLDLTSEGLLLLTNDGELKRRLELPETGWLRRYRVRVNGHPEDAALDRLRAGLEIDGERFAPMQVALDRTQGANAWLTVGLREGRNREIRRAMEAVGVVVARLIRVSYGPFQLGKLAPGAVEELRPRVLRDQLGSLFDGELAEERRPSGSADRPSGKPAGRSPRDAVGGSTDGRKPRPGPQGKGRDDTRPPRGPGRGPGSDGPRKQGGKPASRASSHPSAGTGGRRSAQAAPGSPEARTSRPPSGKPGPSGSGARPERPAGKPARGAGPAGDRPGGKAGDRPWRKPGPGGLDKPPRGAGAAGGRPGGKAGGKASGKAGGTPRGKPGPSGAGTRPERAADRPARAGGPAEGRPNAGPPRPDRRADPSVSLRKGPKSNRKGPGKGPKR